MTSISMTQDVPATNNRLLFLATICAGSFLLFLVQPMIARMALPRLGGAPSVWNSAMLVYQALLLAGYAYAHWLGRFAPRRQAAIHIAVFTVAAIMLPISLSAAAPPSDGSPYFWVPWLLLSSIGPLFFAVAAQAPLMQSWFTLSGGDNPYPLYAASNLGSFGGLIAYPLLVEPLLPVDSQSMLWSAGYFLLAVLIALCAWRLPRGTAAVRTVHVQTPKPAMRTTLRWIALAAVPSGLMLSTTLHLTTDIVAMPLIWVMPLGLYLLSFSLAFAARRWLPDLIVRIAPVFLLFAGCTTFVDATGYPFSFAAATLIALFVISAAMHACMYDLRPAPEHLTRFYLAMSVGGVVGGIFCALIAPLIFDWTYEHPILLMLAALLLPQKALIGKMSALWSGNWAGRVTGWALVAAIFISIAAMGAFGDMGGLPLPLICGSLLALMCIIATGNRFLFAGILVSAMLAFGGWNLVSLSMRDGQMTRSYFGIYSIGEIPGKSKTLVHGTTVHGVQLRGLGQESMPTTYYAPKSGVGLALAAVPQIFGEKARVGVVGLGAGTLNCYARPGQYWRFYEIDPVIVDIARDPKRFTFISKCNPGVDVRIGDARLVLATESGPPANFLAIDAFSSDSVPMHLLTREAFATYRQRLTTNGLLMVHISNRYLNLKPVLAAAAREGWTARIRQYKVTDADRALSYSSSIWVAMSPDPATLNKLEVATGKANWASLDPVPGFQPWTDSYASILPLLLMTK